MKIKYNNQLINIEIVPSVVGHYIRQKIADGTNSFLRPEKMPVSDTEEFVVTNTCMSDNTLLNLYQDDEFYNFVVENYNTLVDDINQDNGEELVTKEDINDLGDKLEHIGVKIDNTFDRSTDKIISALNKRG